MTTSSDLKGVVFVVAFMVVIADDGFHASCSLLPHSGAPHLLELKELFF